MDDNEPTTIFKRDVLGRITLPKAQREALLDEFERSSLKGLPFAKVVGMNHQTFSVWIQKRRRARGEYAQAAAVKNAGTSAVSPPRPLRLIEAGAAPLAVAMSIGAMGKSEALEVAMPGGAKLLTANAAHAALAARLLNSLRTPC